jgi:hypothetical protein
MRTDRRPSESVAGRLHPEAVAESVDRPKAVPQRIALARCQAIRIDEIADGPTGPEIGDLLT